MDQYVDNVFFFFFLLGRLIQHLHNTDIPQSYVFNIEKSVNNNIERKKKYCLIT